MLLFFVILRNPYGNRRGAVVNDDLNGRQSRDWDEVKNENLSFFARSNENKELKDGAMLLRATTIFTEVRAAEKSRISLDFSSPR